MQEDTKPLEPDVAHPVVLAPNVKAIVPLAVTSAWQLKGLAVPTNAPLLKMLAAHKF